MCGRRVNSMCSGCEWHNGEREGDWTGAARSRAESPTPSPPYPKASYGFPNNTTSAPSARAACARGTTRWA